MSSIGILGTGRMGVRLAKMFADASHKVFLGSRSLERAYQIVSSLKNEKIAAATYDEALEADFILPAIFVRDGLFDLLKVWREKIEGKILIDISNPFNNDYTDFVLSWDNSSAEEIQRILPQTHVVGAFKNVWWEVFDQPYFDGLLSDVYVVSDSLQAKADFLSIVEKTSFRYVDAGRLINARTVERMTLLSGELGLRLGFFPRMNYTLLGTNWSVGKGNAQLDAIIGRAL